MKKSLEDHTTQPRCVESVINQLLYYKLIGEKAIAQVPEDKLVWRYNDESNSISMIVKHLWGNMLSRWTDFLSTDGEKAWRDRDSEFEHVLNSRDEIMQKWNEGWRVCLESIQSLKEEDLDRIVYIRNQGHTVMEAINRQLAHYPYHVGQLIFIAKMIAPSWQSLTIPKGHSKVFNESQFAQNKHRDHVRASNPKKSDS